MRVFITGAHGYIGSSVTKQLLASGHQVLGLAHHPHAALKLQALGAESFTGTISDPLPLIEAVKQCNAVITLAFNHHIANDPDFTKFLKSINEDAEAVRVLGNALEGKPMVVAAGYSWPGDSGMIPNLITSARRIGKVGYIGEGQNKWASVHREDAAKLFMIALEKLANGSLPSGRSLHAIGDEGITTKDISEVIAKGLGIQSESITAEECVKRAGPVLGMVWGMEIRVSNEKTKEWTGWEPVECGLLEDIVEGGYLTGPESSNLLPK